MMNNNSIDKKHPSDPRSNVSKFTGYDPDKYTITDVSSTVKTDEGLTPGRPPSLTQQTVGKYLQPLTRELSMIPPCPTIDELPEMVIDGMVLKDKAYWVDKPGANAYTLHDAYYNYGMTTEIVKPLNCEVKRESCYRIALLKVEVLPKSGALTSGGIYHYNLPLLKLKHSGPHCRDCTKYTSPGLTPFQLAWAQDPGQRRWRYYPDLTATLTPEEIKKSMNQVGLPFQNEACNWYYKNYPSIKYDCLLRKFSQ